MWARHARLELDVVAQDLDPALVQLRFDAKVRLHQGQSSIRRRRIWFRVADDPQRRHASGTSAPIDSSFTFVPVKRVAQILGLWGVEAAFLQFFTPVPSAYLAIPGNCPRRTPAWSDRVDPGVVSYRRAFVLTCFVAGDRPARPGAVRRSWRGHGQGPRRRRPAEPDGPCRGLCRGSLVAGRPPRSRFSPAVRPVSAKQIKTKARRYQATFSCWSRRRSMPKRSRGSSGSARRSSSS